MQDSIRQSLTRCITPAKYVNSFGKKFEEFHHSGIAADIYTHFTSPIRRYSDVVVHRLLAASIKLQPPPPNLLK